MRIMAQMAAKPSAWTRQREVIEDSRGEAAVEESRKELSASEEGGDKFPPNETTNDNQPVAETESSQPVDSANAPGSTPDDGQDTHEKAEVPDSAAADVTSAEKNDASVEGGIPKVESSPEVDANEISVESKKPGTDAEDPEEDAKKAGTDSGDSSQIVMVEKGDSSPVHQAKEQEPEDDKPNTAIDKSRSKFSVKQDAPARAPTIKASGETEKRLGRSSSVGRATTTKLPKYDPKTKLRATTALLKTHKAAQETGEDPAETAARKKEEQEAMAEQRAYQKELAKEARDDERERRNEDRDEQRKIREETRQWDAQRREDARKAINDAANKNKDALSLQDLEKIKAQNQFVERFSGMAENQQEYSFDPTAPRGPSQTVTYSSRFVDRLSDVTDDMCISGSLSIKAAKIGGSGKGSFVDSDKFKESDMNFYISVKVVNQTVNFKDALVYNPLRSVDDKNFQKVYGDTFISGFLEGGEFNAIVSMKIHNKAKMTDIKAEAKVALTAGPVDITAEANVGIARSNIETNTETTIQVSWAGGGHIKPMEQQWDIKSLMQAAARFPDLVADCPQRTYAILTKYETLRSFVARQPAAYTPLQYENAQLYTNALLESFMSYKAIYKRLGEQIFNVQGKTMEVVSWEKHDEADATGSSQPTETQQVATTTKTVTSTGPKKDGKSGQYPYVEDVTRFEASVKGLSDARTAIRRQMARIVNEVDIIEKDPKLATDEDHQEPFQSSVTFETRIPEVRVPARLQAKSQPLTGKRIMAKTQTEQDQKDEADAQDALANMPALYSPNDEISLDEKSALDKIKQDRPDAGEHLRVSSAAGSTDKGAPFNNLDFLQADWTVESVSIEIADGGVASVSVFYDNGLLLKKGAVSSLWKMCPNQTFCANQLPLAVTWRSYQRVHTLPVRRESRLGLHCARSACWW